MRRLAATASAFTAGLRRVAPRAVTAESACLGAMAAAAAAQARHGRSDVVYLGNCRKMDSYFADTWGRQSRLAVAAPAVAAE